jgi:hypothetical protein
MPRTISSALSVTSATRASTVNRSVIAPHRSGRADRAQWARSLVYALLGMRSTAASLVLVVLVLAGIAAATERCAAATEGRAAATEGHAAVTEGRAAVTEVIAEVRRATVRYLDVDRAREDGFVQASGMQARHGVHFVHPRSAAGHVAGGAVDLARPPVLLYVERGGQWQLAGVEYALAAIPATSPFPATAWKRHEAACHYRDGQEVAAAAAGACPARHPASGAEFVLWHPALAVVHVWAWYPNPDGPFAGENRYLDAWGVAPPPASHRHARTPLEVRYSELNHRVAGLFLLVLAVVTGWTARAGRGRVVLGGLWMAFGAYVFVAADPEAWPLGPKTFRDVFDDGLVIQHKLLALLPGAIGLAEMLRGMGAATRLAWSSTLSAVAVAGGLALFWHDHEGGLDWSRGFVQHAALGVASLAAGLVLFFTGAAGRLGERVVWAWPALLFATALVLLFYAE